MARIDKCPGCGCSKGQVLGNSDGFCEVLRGTKYYQEPFCAISCERCGLVYKDHILDRKSINEYYNDFDFHVWNSEAAYPTEKEIRRHLISVSGLNVLDYGCSDGRFLSSYTSRHSCYGYDLNRKALNEAANRGINILEIGELNNKEGFFDFIIISDVFEHSYEPTELIRFLIGKLATGGSLIVSTGYADSRVLRTDPANSWYFSTVQHFSMLGEKYISFLLDELRLKLVSKKRLCHYKINLTAKCHYWIRFELFRFFHLSKYGFFLRRILRKLPLIKKIAFWRTIPYYPYSKDHVVFVLRKCDS